MFFARLQYICDNINGADVVPCAIFIIMMDTKRPLILVSNDDGYSAKGINCLVKVLAEFGDVVAVGVFSLNGGFAVPTGAHSGQFQGQAVGEQLEGGAGAETGNQIVQIGVG